MRAFVAVEITEPSILKKIKNLQSKMGEALKGAKPTDAGILHFTLQFLGEVPDSKIQSVIDAVSSTRFSRFDVEIAGLGAFPNGRSPRAIWVGARDVASTEGTGNGSGGGGKSDGNGSSRALSDLAQKVSDSLAPVGYLRDKRFVAHSTIFRIKKKGIGITDELKRHSDMVFGVQSITRFKLKKSVLTPTGPIYTDLMENVAVQ